MGKKKSKSKMVLGYTRSGHPVMLPTRQTPDMTEFGNWVPGDHIDASRILVEHGERESDPVGPWCAHWASAHWAIGKRSTRKKLRRMHVRGAAEIAIKPTRRR